MSACGRPGRTRGHDCADMVLYAVTDLDWRLTRTDVEPIGESTEARIPQGQELFMETSTHKAEEIGANESFAIAVELY